MAESRDALLDVWKVYDAHQDRVHQEVLAAALSHPELGRVAQRAPVAQLAHRISSFRELLGRGVLEGDFGPWLRHVREQGVRQAGRDPGRLARSGPRPAARAGA